MQKKVFIKHFLPLIIAFGLAFIFFSSYNHYLLDNTFANLKVSLRQLEEAQDIEQAKGVKDILSDAFLIEMTKGNFDLSLAGEAEELKKDTSPKAAQTKKYSTSLVSATKMEVAADFVDLTCEQTQIADAKYFL